MRSSAARGFASERQTSRRGHAPQISISDTNHHVTEAIGGMYGSDDDDYLNLQTTNQRPLSFIPSPRDVYAPSEYYDRTRTSPTLSPPASMQDRTGSRTENSKAGEPTRRISPGQHSSATSPSPPLTRSSSTDTAVQQFPLNDIDYESSPAAVAQELSNLQAIRRMSMNVDNADPDLPGFSSGFSMPSLSPNEEDQNDPSKLFWVPARLHPELAPVEFKTFIDDRVDRMRRLSDDGQSLVPDELEGGIATGIKRKKSMLSRQVHSEKGYQDGAERLERKRSEGKHYEPRATDNLAELEELVSDPASLIRRLSLDSVRRSQDSAIVVPQTDDSPILPGMAAGLKRSTRTAYRRGSLRKGERAPASRRAIERQADLDVESPSQSPIIGPDEPIPGITRVQTDPTHSSSFHEPPAENFSRPGRRTRPVLGPSNSSDRHVPQIKKPSPPSSRRSSPPHERPEPDSRAQQFHSRIATGGWTTAQLPGQHAPVPQIIETPPPPEPTSLYPFPERKSSIQSPILHSPQSPRQGPLVQGARSRQYGDKKDSDSTLDDISSNPSLLPGSGGSRTDDLTMVPTFDTKKPDPKTSRKTSWGWLTGEKDKEKERERLEKDKEREREKDKEREKEMQKLREKEEKEKERLRRPKISSKLANQDKTRLDVLQTSIDGGSTRGRESIVLNREDIKLEEERKKESSRKSKPEEGKKEKDGLLSAIFGGGKRSKGTDDNSKKRNAGRSLSPEPPAKVLKPDIDYNWTRFSILEERAIYRMAHIKLANPKRALYSQVLLSNFMYSYLAKVQMMHPQMQTTGETRHQQQQKQHQQQQHQQQKVRPKKKEENASDEFVQYQRYQAQQARTEDHHEYQAAETGSLSNRRSNEGYGSYGYNQHNTREQHDQHNQHSTGMNGDHRGAYSGAGAVASVGGVDTGIAAPEQSYQTDFLGYAQNSQPFGGGTDRWGVDDSNMFEGLS